MKTYGWDKGDHYVGQRGDEDDGRSDKQSDTGAEVKVLWPEREPPFAFEVGGIVDVERVSFTGNDRGTQCDGDGTETQTDVLQDADTAEEFRFNG